MSPLRKSRYEVLWKNLKWGSIMLLPLSLGIWLAGSEWFDHDRRKLALSERTRALAVVTVSGYEALEGRRWSRHCGIIFRYKVSDKKYLDSAAGCELVEKYPVGSRIRVAYSGKEPEFAFPVDEGHWRFSGFASFLLGLVFFFVGLVLWLTLIGPSVGELVRRRLRRMGLISART